MRNFLSKLFSIQKRKVEKTYYILGFKFRFRNYKYMIREMYARQNQEHLKKRLKQRNINLPADAVLYGETEIVDVALKDIRRKWKGKIYSLEEVSPFQYLMKRDKSIYMSYICKHFSADNQPSEEMLEKYLSDFNSLEESINSNGYDLSKSIIALNRDNIVVDGQRRACVLLYKYGRDHKITVVREK